MAIFAGHRTSLQIVVFPVKVALLFSPVKVALSLFGLQALWGLKPCHRTAGVQITINKTKCYVGSVFNSLILEHLPSVLWHCWLGDLILTRKNLSLIRPIVFDGTLNLTQLQLQLTRSGCLYVKVCAVMYICVHWVMSILALSDLRENKSSSIRARESVLTGLLQYCVCHSGVHARNSAW